MTSESVSESHPDKVCDRISDAILDFCLAHDPEARVACETMVCPNRVILAGEITCRMDIDNYIDRLVRTEIEDLGYNSGNFNYQTVRIENYLHSQSSDISQGVTEGEGLHTDQGAGDQGIMFGFACRDTEEYMPAALMYSHRIMRRLADLRRNSIFRFLLPDGKCQVTVEYEDERVVAIPTIVVSQQHTEDINREDLYAFVQEHVIEQVFLGEMELLRGTTLHVNPTGRFVLGGPEADSGLTGRKIVVDNYGGSCPVGGGAFSGKDPSKVDRSAAYLARYLAKNVVLAGICDICTIQIGYAIGIAEPVSLRVDTGKANKLKSEVIARILREEIDMTPAGIIKRFRLKRDIYKPTSSFGHFGNYRYPWEVANPRLIERLMSEAEKETHGQAEERAG